MDDWNKIENLATHIIRISYKESCKDKKPKDFKINHNEARVFDGARYSRRCGYGVVLFLSHPLLYLKVWS